MIAKIQEWIASKAIRKYLPSVVRHGLTLLAGVLVAAGLPELAEQVVEMANPLSEIAVGVAIFLFAQLWSFKDKNPPAEPKPIINVAK